jgi:hypothetical protein
MKSLIIISYCNIISTLRNGTDSLKRPFGKKAIVAIIVLTVSTALSVWSFLFLISVVPP